MLSIRIVSYNKSQHLICAVESILRSELKTDYEILILENGSDPKNIEEFQGYMNMYACHRAFPNRVVYFHDQGNFGLSKGLNFLNSKSSPDTEFIVELNEDMFFHPKALQKLMDALSIEESLGLACSSMTNGGIYDKKNPSRDDVINFFERNKDLPSPKLGLGASNLPWCLTKSFYEELQTIDVWEDRPPLFLNKFPGIWDESIDELCAWTSDWDIHGRVRASNKSSAIVEDALVYHYDHCSGELLDKESPGWTNKPVKNYICKWGKFEKDRPFNKKKIPSFYPQ